MNSKLKKFMKDFGHQWRLLEQLRIDPDQGSKGMDFMQSFRASGGERGLKAFLP